MNFSIHSEIKKIILNTDKLKNTYTKNYSNSKHSLDLIIKELIFFMKSGNSWNTFRSPIKSKTLYWHFQKFVAFNIFLRLFNKIRNVYLKNYIQTDVTLLIDSTSIPNKNGINKIGRNKFYKNKKCTKISLMTDINGFPLSILFLKGNFHDIKTFKNHIRDAQIIIPKHKKTILADKAYAAKSTYDLLADKDIAHIIPPRKNMLIHSTYTYSKQLYAKRIKIEHMFGRLKMIKRIMNRYDKLLRYFAAFVYLAFAILSDNIIKKLNS